MLRPASFSTGDRYRKVECHRCLRRSRYRGLNYSDPFGLCVKEDINCHNLVRMLRQQDGAEFQRAAKQYESLKEGRVHFVAKSQLKDRLGQQLYGLAPVGKDGDVWLVGEQSKADLLLTGVHEAKHLAGHYDDQPLVQTVYNAWMQLSRRDRGTAVNTADWLWVWTKGQVGRPATQEAKP